MRIRFYQNPRWLPELSDNKRDVQLVSLNEIQYDYTCYIIIKHTFWNNYL